MRLLEGGRDIVATIFAHNCGQYFVNRLMSLDSHLIVEDTTTKIVNTLYVLIFTRKLRYHCEHLCPSRWPQLSVWMNVIPRPPDYATCETKNRLHCLDAHF